jgi:hypothetical protein
MTVDASAATPAVDKAPSLASDDEGACVRDRGGKQKSDGKKKRKEKLAPMPFFPRAPLPPPRTAFPLTQPRAHSLIQYTVFGDEAQVGKPVKLTVS